MTNAEIADRLALKELVDTFSILADQKQTRQQTLLFTENAVVESVVNGQKTPPLTGRKQIGDAFAGFLSQFETVYHLNGQQQVTLCGDRATGVSYCQVTLIGLQNGQPIKTTMGVYYHDSYVRQQGHWLIDKRVSHFTWQDRQPLGR